LSWALLSWRKDDEMSNGEKKGILAEVRGIFHCATQVWKLVPRPQKIAFGLAALIMAITSAGNTAVALLLGTLVDRIRIGLDHNWAREDLYWAAGWVLGFLALVYVLREALHVARRYLVENSCTRINANIKPSWSVIS